MLARETGLLQVTYVRVRNYIVEVVVVLRVSQDSWRSYNGFSKQELLSRSGLPLPSTEFISHLCVPYSESFPLPAFAMF